MAERYSRHALDQTVGCPRRTMQRILSRLLVRLAILAASLAWAGFVFTETVGDPGRGERIAAAVLADDDARDEVAAPIASAVMTTFGIPPEQRPIVADQVDRTLNDPAGARSFIDPFAGSWARMLGEDDPRPTEFDLAPLLAQFAATAPPGTIDAIPPIPERLPVPGVPLPRTRLDWMADVRSAISMVVVPLALAAAVMFAVAYATGDRARVLRRLGIWGIAAGASWIMIPPMVVWLTRRWAPGADAVAAVALDEAVSGLLPVAIALSIGGGAALAGSFAVSPARDRAAAPRPRARPATPSRPARVAASITATEAATRAMPRARPIEPTAEMPVVHAPAQRPSPSDPVARDDDESDALWDFYSS
jgi:hypothetical protein